MPKLQIDCLTHLNQQISKYPKIQKFKFKFEIIYNLKILIIHLKKIKLKVIYMNTHTHAHTHTHNLVRSYNNSPRHTHVQFICARTLTDVREAQILFLFPTHAHINDILHAYSHLNAGDMLNACMTVAFFCPSFRSC